MPVITKTALQWMQDEHESLQSQVDSLEEELEKALEEVRSLRIINQQLMTDRSLAV